MLKPYVIGYGCDLKTTTWKPDAHETLYRNFRTDMKAFFDDCLAQHNNEATANDEPPIDAQDFLDAFFKEYENLDNGNAGFYGALCDVINENEFDSPLLICKDGYLYAPAKSYETDGRIFTKQKIRITLRKYLSQLTVEVPMFFTKTVMQSVTNPACR